MQKKFQMFSRNRILTTEKKISIRKHKLKTGKNFQRLSRNRILVTEKDENFNIILPLPCVSQTCPIGPSGHLFLWWPLIALDHLRWNSANEGSNTCRKNIKIQSKISYKCYPVFCFTQKLHKQINFRIFYLNNWC